MKPKFNKNELNSLKGRYQDRAVLIVSAGPSANNWREVYNEIKDQNPIVVCIKQTIEMDGLDELCDIHFINPYNIKKYKYKKKPLIIFSDALDAPKVFNSYDFRLIVNKKNNATLESTVAYNENFDDFLIDRTGVYRPWGPGIIYESVFYMLIFMGVKKVFTVGWDIADKDGNNKHYYDKKFCFTKVNSLIRRLSAKLKLYTVYSYCYYICGGKYNFAGMLDGEANMISDSLPSFKKWLESKNIEIEIFSESEWMK